MITFAEDIGFRGLYWMAGIMLRPLRAAFCG